MDDINEDKDLKNYNSNAVTDGNTNCGEKDLQVKDNAAEMLMVQTANRFQSNFVSMNVLNIRK